MKIYTQSTPYDSPWSFRDRLRMLLFEYVWLLLCSWTPKPANTWRIWCLGRFGARIHGRPFVHQRARIQVPWNLVLHDRATVGDRCNLYSLDVIEIQAHATVAQEAYLCTGTHAFDRPEQNLMTAPVTVKEYAFIGARAFIMPGVTIGRYAVVGSCSVVTRNVADHSRVKGNPAK